ncbi:hypothetical protein [Brevundimonas nasdae]|uniref:XRE family transcriptional regulator n=1 Tax=Brevundimonas nasdae TaxID=172043 RepID=A0ABX8TJV9_9CAUL|nr:hypothetical protein [Brevundimonas nasdae]QYC11495.1 hypothetical protein KWG56_05830 [Brevundimonas nasdae]QYC14283.1 hypothetical protein KWG63_01165 [Brevundimonas nasdae]
MSPTQKDRKLRSNSGRSLLRPPQPDQQPSFAEAVADAIRREFGGTPGSVKRVVRLTRANERAVRNWFEAKNAPSGENLVVLMRHSDEVLETVLALADRQDLVAARKLAAAREKLEEMLAMIDELQTG